MDLTARTVRTTCGEDIRLTGAEFSALHALVAAGGEAVSRDRLSEVALRRTRHSDDRSVDKLIGKLRQKLNTGDGQTQIQCGHGGYRLMISEPDAWRVPPGPRPAGADAQMSLYQPALA
jgi:DNA-binding response OmpR family regulator